MISLTAKHLELFEAGCANPQNTDAQALLNTFGVAGAADVLERMPSAPLSLLVDLATHFWGAVNYEAQRLAS